MEQKLEGDRYRDQEEAVTPLLRRSPSDDVPLQRQAVLPAARARSLLSRQNLPLQSPGSSPSGALLHPTAAESISNTAPLPRTGVEAVTDATPTDGATARAESTPAFDDELQRQGGVSKTIKTRATRPPLPLRPSSPSTGNIPILSPPVLSRSSSRGNDVVTRRFAANSSPARSDEGSGLPSAHSSAIMNNDVPLSRAGVVSGTGGMTLDAGADVHRPSVAHYHTPGATAGVLQHEAASTPLAIRTPATSTAQSVTLTPASGPVNSGASLWRRAARAALSGTSSQLHSTAWALRAGQRGIARGRGRRGGGAGGLPGLGREDGIGENESLMGGGGGGAVEVYRVPGGARQEGRLGDDGGDAEEGGSGGGEVLEEGGRGLNVNVSLTAQAVDPASMEIRNALESSQNTLPLLLLLGAHYIFTHLLGILAFIFGTSVLAGLDQKLRLVTDSREAKNGAALLALALMAVLVVVASALVLGQFPDGEGLLGGLLLWTPKLGDASAKTNPATDSITFSVVIRTVAVVDLWARLLSIAVKALLALLVAPNNADSNPSCCSRFNAARRLSSWHCCFCPRDGRRRRASDSGGSGGAGAGYCCSRIGGSSFRMRQAVGLTTSGSLAHASSVAGVGVGGGGGGGGGFAVRVCDRAPCGTVGRCVFAHFVGRAFGSCCFGWCRRRSGGDGLRRTDIESSGGRGQSGPGEYGAANETDDVEEREGLGVVGTGVLLGRGARQRRIYALVEMTFMLYRTLLPVPVWLEYYSKDGDHFAAIYLVLKGMVFFYRADRLARAVCYVRRGNLERGKFATPQEVAEAGSPDCCICYERMARPVLLPCEHMFCGECVTDWLERERTCPLCRSEVPTTNPISRGLRNGQTSILPQIL